jgi:hypothetical protein
MNNFFSSIAQKLDSKLPPGNHLDLDIASYVPNICELEEVSSEEVLRTILSMYWRTR